MQVVGVQLDTAWEDVATNCGRTWELLSAAPIETGALVVLPEMFTAGFTMCVERADEGTDRPGERILRSLATRHRAFVVGGVVNRAADGRGRNEAVVVGPHGEEVARYAKLHPFSPAGEDVWYEAGERVVWFEWGDLPVSPIICYDLRFPEVCRKAVRSGVGLFVVIANFPAARHDHWRTLLSARAIENQAYVVGINRAGGDPNQRYDGDSRVIDPAGRTVAEAGSDETLLFAEVDAEAVAEARRGFPALADARPERLGA